MAGEWLKFDASTPDKPEVLAITVAMGWDDPDLTVGKLLRVWRWFDQQTIDGNAVGVTSALLDRLLGVSGLCAAMAKVGWLLITDEGLNLPNFDRHNGKTAKDRALTAKRVANHKANAKGNGVGNGESVSGALPREEKRREDSNTPQAPHGGSPVGFDEFWTLYPRHTAKQNAVKAWIKVPVALHETIFAAVKAQARSSNWTKDGGQFIPHAASWINGKRWEDEPTEVGDAPAVAAGVPFV